MNPSEIKRSVCELEFFLARISLLWEQFQSEASVSVKVRVSDRHVSAADECTRFLI